MLKPGPTTYHAGPQNQTNTGISSGQQIQSQPATVASTQPTKVLTGDLDSSLASLAENLTINKSASAQVKYDNCKFFICSNLIRFNFTEESSGIHPKMQQNRVVLVGHRNLWQRQQVQDIDQWYVDLLFLNCNLKIITKYCKI